MDKTGKKLVVVESPTKARTLARFLGGDYHIEATMGHVRDLPQDRLGVNINDNFEPTYIVPPKKKRLIANLRKEVFKRKQNHLILATDPDREGEAIAWHIKEALTKRRKKEEKEKELSISRIVFHEITKRAIENSLKHPRDINDDLVDAQQGRRILDRLVGYKLSPILWYKTGKKWLSAGRVQSVAVRLIVEREREIEAFKSEEYWEIYTKLKSKNEKGKTDFIAQLVKVKDEKAEVKNKKQADIIVKALEKAGYKVLDVREKETQRTPPPPFTTATMQRAASNVFSWSAKKTMIIAQNLYEKGLITYHRTDSVNIAREALFAARKHIAENYGEKYLPDGPRIYKTKSRLAQEAHEAIRPTSLETRNKKQETGNKDDNLGKDHSKLLELITKRFVVSQMKEEKVLRTTADILADKDYLLQAKGERILFDGWRILYKINSQQTTNNKQQETENILPPLVKDEILDLVKVLPEQKFTQPPARYNEASLIKALEEKGIGRPSTYAPIISTIQQRQYVEKIDRRYLKPTELGVAVNDFLVSSFPKVVDVSFTAKMEEDLDHIAHGKVDWHQAVGDFWGPFEKTLGKVKESNTRVRMKVEKVDEKCPKDGGQLVVRVGRYGKFLACGNFPNCKFTKPLVEKVNIKCPECGGDVVFRKTRKGRPFYGCSNYPTCKFSSWRKPKEEEKK